MEVKRIIIGLLYALSTLFGTVQEAWADASPRRVANLQEAVKRAGADGVIVFLYGPDWNRRSTILLKQFWQTPAVETASGGAILVAYPVPANIHTLPSPLTSCWPICPSLIFLDAQGKVYTALHGMEAIGDEKGSGGLRHISEQIRLLRERNRLAAQARVTQGKQRAEFLHLAGELPFTPPKRDGNKARTDLAEQIRRADPSDSEGYARRLTYNPLAFMYEQLETRDGFLSPRFVPDYEKIKTNCMRIISDTALRAEDRQQAYTLLIGLAHQRQERTRTMREMIENCMQLDRNSSYGRLSPRLMELWATQQAARGRGARGQIRDKRKK